MGKRRNRKSRKKITRFSDDLENEEKPVFNAIYHATKSSLSVEIIFGAFIRIYEQAYNEQGMDIRKAIRATCNEWDTEYRED